MPSPSSRLARLREVGLGADPEPVSSLLDDDLADLDDAIRTGRDDQGRGWTPPEISRHRDPGAATPRLQIGWRAGAVLAAMVVAAGAAVGLRHNGSEPQSVPERSPVAEQSSPPPGLPGTAVPTTAVPTTAAPTTAAPTTAGGAGSAPGAGAGAAAGVTAHVVGAVTSPGVVRLGAGSRVGDAVTAAGGARPDADLTGLNLARVLADGEQVVVPTPGQLVPAAPAAGSPAAGPTAPGAGSSAGAAGGGAAAAGSPVNLNTATQADLDALPGIGPVLAARIVEWRTANGQFTSVDELGEVSGIGDAVLARLRPLVSV